MSYIYINSTIEFPYDFDSGTFISDHYFSGMTRNKVSVEEAREVLSHIGSHVDRYYQGTFYCRYEMLCQILFVWVVLFLPILLFLGSTWSNPFAIVLASSFVICGIACLILVYVTRARVDKHLIQNKQEIQKYLDKRSASYQDLVWIILSDFPKSIVLGKKSLDDFL